MGSQLKFGTFVMRTRLALLLASAIVSCAAHQPITKAMIGRDTIADCTTSLYFAPAQKIQSVMLIHGILGSPWNMKYYADLFSDEGVTVNNWGYASRDKRILEHAKDLVIELQRMAKTKPGHPINFVAHSMGGLVLRGAINHPKCPFEAKIGRTVLLAPPNQGASWGKFLHSFPFLRVFTREKADTELMTAENFEYLGQFPPTMDVLVIAGDWNFNPVIKGENDGTVAVKETFLSTPHLHSIVNTGHKTILINQEALQLTENFIKNGKSCYF